MKELSIKVMRVTHMPDVAVSLHLPEETNMQLEWNYGGVFKGYVSGFVSTLWEHYYTV